MMMCRTISAASLVVLATTLGAEAKSTESVLHDFGETQGDGLAPQDGVIADAQGNLYGTTIVGGLFNKGAVYVVGANGLETVIYSFSGGPSDGEEPNATLTMDKHGVLYGTTLIGGAANKGTVFKLAPNGEAWEESVLYSFCSLANCADGNSPASPITVGAKGVLFGTTQIGGAGTVQPNSGTVYRLDPPGKHGTTWTESVLYNFCSQVSCADGRAPYSRPLLAKDGFLYGTVAQSQQGGTIYRVSPIGGGFSVMHTFPSFTGDGATPVANLNPGKDGVLYGATSQGGANGCGSVFSFDPASFVYRQLYACTGGTGPATFYGGITPAENKHGVTLYGASLAGGVNAKGAIFALTPSQDGNPWSEETLYSFCSLTNCVDGATPAFGTLLDIGGALYGTTSAGGTQNFGTVFRFGKK